jgi:hypothetical protein
MECSNYFENMEAHAAQARTTPPHRKSEEPVKILLSYTAPKADPAKDFTLHGLWSWDLIGVLARMGFLVESAFSFLNPDFMNVG